MSTKTKTFYECCYEIAKEDGYSWEGFVKLYGYTGKAIKWIERAVELYAFDKIKRAIELARQESKEDVCENCGADSGLHQYETGLCPLGGREETRFDKLSGKWFPQKWQSTTFKMKVGNKYTEQEILDMVSLPSPPKDLNELKK